MIVFACSLSKPNTEVFFGSFVANPNELHVTHCAAYGDKVTLVSGSECSEQELDSLEVAYPKVFSEPT